MVLFNYSTKELTAKVVYYGPGLCGKTTNLHWIHEKLPIKNKGKMLSLATETDRTLFFDFLPIELGTIRGMRTRIQLYTVPGQVFYNATRRMVLKGADCVVFVCDSQEPMLEANIESLENLRQNLEANEIDPDEIPMVLQYNKRDLPNALPIEILGERLNEHDLPFYEAVAIKGTGVEETLKGATALVFRSLAAKYGAGPAAHDTAPAPATPLLSEETPIPDVLPQPPPAPPPRAARATPAEVPPQQPPAPPTPSAPAAPPETRPPMSPPQARLVPEPETESLEEDEDLLESLELQPTSEAIDDDETRAADAEPLVVEESELSLSKGEDLEPFEEEEFNPEELSATSAAVEDALDSEEEEEEAEALRRRRKEEEKEAEALRRQLDDEEEASILRRHLSESVAADVSLEDIEEEEEEERREREAESPSAEQEQHERWSGDVKAGEATLISFEDALMREALKKYSQAPPPAPPPHVDVGMGTVDVTVPVDVEVQDGVAQVQVTLHLTLNVKRQR